MIRSALVALLMRVSGSALWLIYTIILARSLTQEQFGLTLFVISLMLLTTPIASMGFEISTLRHVIRYKKTKNFRLMAQIVREGQFVAIIGAALVSSGVLVLSIFGYIPLNSNPTYLGLTVLGIGISTVMALNRSVLRGQGKTAQSLFGFTIMRPLIPTSLAVAFFSSDTLNATTALLTYIIGLTVAVAIEEVLLRRDRIRKSAKTIKKFVSTRHLKRHLSVGFGVWPGEMSNAVVAKIGGLVVASILGLEAAALYLAAERISALAEFLIDAVRYGAAPEIANSSNKDHQQLQASVTKASALMLISGLVGSIGLLMVGYFILGLMGEVYTKSYPVLVGMIVGYLSRAVLGPVAIIMSMCGLEREFSAWSLINACLATVLAVLGTVTLGLPGAAVGFATAAWINSFTLHRTINKRLGIKCGLQSLTLEVLKQITSQTQKSIWAATVKMRKKK